MKDIPRDPFQLQGRVIAALCDDLFDIGAGLSTTFDRTEAIRVALIARDSAEAVAAAAVSGTGGGSPDPARPAPTRSIFILLGEP